MILNQIYQLYVRRNVTQNNAENHSDTSLQTNVQNGPQSDEILSDLKNLNLPKDDYALLGYHNEAYVKDEDENIKDAVFLDVPGTDPGESIPVCHSIDSSPSKSSVSSNGSPKKKGKFVTQVSVHVIEYSDNPAKSVKLESPDNETNRDTDLTDVKNYCCEF